VIARRWTILFVLFVTRTAVAFQFQTVAALRPILMSSFDLDFAWIGALIGVYMLPGLAFSLPSGMLGQKIDAKVITIAGLVLMAFGGATTAVDSFGVMFSGRLISGAGAVLINVVLTKMVTDWFEGHEIVPAMSIFIASWPLGLSLGMVLLPVLASVWSWQAAMLAVVLFSLCCLALIAISYHDPERSADSDTATFRWELSRHEWKLITLAGTMWTTYNVAYIVLISFLPDIFMKQGYSLAEANRLVSWLGWILIPSVPLCGLLAGWLKKADLIMTIGFVVTSLAACGLAFSDRPQTFFWLLAFGSGLPAGLIMALTAQALNRENRSIGMGVFYSYYYLGMAALPPVAGWIRDASGSEAAIPLFASFMIFVALLGLAGFRYVQLSLARADARADEKHT